MKLKHTKLFAAAVAAIAIGASTSQANLLVNGDFEAGLAGWTGTPLSGITATDQHAGHFAAELGPALGSIYQFVAPPLILAQTYKLDFWAKDSGNAAGTSQTLSATVFNGLSASFDTTAAYVHYSYLFTYTGGPSVVAFGWSDGLERVFVDDASLVAVPEPTTIIAGALLLLPFGASTLRFIRRSRATV